jgi:hypothetical protein
MSKLTFYMKSGNVIIQRGVKTWKTTYDPRLDTLTGIEVTFHPWPWSRKRIIFSSLVLEQIECIVNR